MFHPSIFAYIHKKDIAAFFELVVEGLKTPPEALEDERFDYLSAQEKLFCAKAFVYHLDNVLPRPEVPDHVEDWMATYVR
ncbi:hypothetical protein [Labrenzia sp. 011]|uniref:hypothetical protein n=1 Tax=Labrenzia sp. 011 TaxID=2171494 RepID=UPI00105741F6|nr:hypothetical protein [Labrenzia sp. 011]